jgi:FemAB-related protein (PEP-CTERM system-associated)
MLAVEVNPEVSVEEWEAYVKSHPEGAYCHLPQWQAVITAGLGYKPFYVFAKNEKGKLCGVLPLFLVGGVLTGSRLVSLPFANACGPIADSSDTIEALVNRAKGLCDEMRCRYLEIRTIRPVALGLEVNEFFHTYVLELSESRIVWERADRRARWAVGKAGREGVVVRVDDSDRGLETFCDLNLRTKRRHGVPTHSSSFFKAMRQHLKGHFRLYLAEVEGKVVAGAVEINFNGVTDYGHAASNTSYRQHYPNDAITWRAIEDGCNEGCRCFDFGKTDSDNVSLAQFKKKWGAQERTLYYHYYPKRPGSVSQGRYGIEGITYRLATGLWKNLPLPLLRILNRIAIRHLG